MVVAMITKDHLCESGDQAERVFEYQAMKNWYWDVEEMASEAEYEAMSRTLFKLYDDDGELYYSGWLKNDDACIVQRFVLRWAEAHAGCTTILIYKDRPSGWVQEIG